MLNRQREVALPRPTAAPTATSSAYLLTLQFLWGQAFESAPRAAGAGEAAAPAPPPAAAESASAAALGALRSEVAAAQDAMRAELEGEVSSAAAVSGLPCNIRREGGRSLVNWRAIPCNIRSKGVSSLVTPLFAGGQLRTEGGHGGERRA